MAESGIPTGAMAAPIIPFINDHELEAIAEACVGAGALSVGYILLRLPGEVKDLFEEWLKAHFPMKAEHVMARIRDTRGGAAYRSEWGVRMRGEGVFAELIAKRFAVIAKRLGVEGLQLGTLRTDLFRRPYEQLGLL